MQLRDELSLCQMQSKKTQDEALSLAIRAAESEMELQNALQLLDKTVSTAVAAAEAMKGKVQIGNAALLEAEVVRDRAIKEGKHLAEEARGKCIQQYCS
jgi:hypothetical protein